MGLGWQTKEDQGVVMSDMDEIEQSIMTALRKAYQLGLDDGRNRIAELDAEREKVEDKLAELVQRVRDWNARLEHSTVLEHILTKYEVGNVS